MKRGHIIIFLMLLFLIPSVSAMGLRGSDLLVNVDFKPKMVLSYTYTIRTTSSQTMDYELYARGDLVEYVTLIPERLYSIKPGSYPRFRAVIRLPERIEPPGIHKLRIGAVETLASGGMVGSKTGSEAIINIRVLYPGKYLRASLDAPNVNVHEPVNFVVDLENWGKEDIKKVKAVIEVYDQNNQSLATLHTEESSIESAGATKLHAILDTIGYPPAEYRAAAIIDWDGNRTKVEDYFKIGTLFVDIVSYTSVFPKGKINPFNIGVESGWNNLILDVWAEITIDGKRIQTPTTDLQPWERKTLTAYWDTTNVKLGEYDATIVLHYAGRTTTKIVKVKVEEVKEVVERPAAIISTTTLVILLIVLLVAVNIFWLIYLEKRRSKSKKK